MKEKPIITHTEILVLAAKALTAEISEWTAKAGDDPKLLAMLSTAVDPLEEKLEAIRTLYRIETGTTL